MSAWIVSKTHIDALVHAGIDAECIRPEEADEFGRMLWQENLNSIHARYADTAATHSNYPGPIDFKGPADVDAYTYEPMEGGPGITLKAPAVVHYTAACYDYQSCEHAGWDGSRAHLFVGILMSLTSDKGKGPWGTDTRDAYVKGASVDA